MISPPNVVTSIRWSAVFPWLILVRGARVALMVRVLLLAIIGVFLTQAGWRLIESMPLGESALPVWDASVQPLPQPVAASDGVESARIVAFAKERLNVGPLVAGWRWLSRPFCELHYASGWQAWAKLSLAGLWSIAVWGLFGGAIGRIAAVHLTYGETIGPIAALRAAIRKWPSIFAAPLLAGVALAVLAAPLAVAGLLLRFDLFAVVIGFLWLFALLGGVAVAIIAVGLLFGWPLMWSTVAIERTDAFDSISRAYAYAYQRPLHLAFYILVASLLGLLAQGALDLFVYATLAATEWAVGLGAGDTRWAELLAMGSTPPADGAATATLGARAIYFWSESLRAASTSFPLAYLWPAVTAIYLLLRREIDGTEMTEVVFDEGDPKRGLPILAPDAATGVPQVAQRESESAPRATPPAEA